MWTSTRAPAAVPGPWIHSRRWDLTFIFASVFLVAVPFATYHLALRLTGAEPRAFQHDQALSVAMLINLATAFLIGGPHLYATLTTTLAESRFRRRYRRLLWSAAAIPPLVIGLAVFRIELLIALFFAWASVHVIHQLVYLVRQYQDRSSPAASLPRWSRGIDYVLALSCLYPLAAWRLVAEPGSTLQLPLGLQMNAGFWIGKVDVAAELPAAVQGETWIAVVVAAVFAAALAAFIGRTAWEIASGTVVWPRTLLLATTVPVAFALPFFENLDVALQGFNLWHSAQYIGLVFLMNRYRLERGEMSSPLMAWLTREVHGVRYYAFLVAVSLMAGAVMGILRYGLGLPMLQVYYCVHFSALWIHYLWDHAVFVQWDALGPPVAFGGDRP